MCQTAEESVQLPLLIDFHQSEACTFSLLGIINIFLIRGAAKAILFVIFRNYFCDVLKIFKEMTAAKSAQIAKNEIQT